MESEDLTPEQRNKLEELNITNDNLSYSYLKLRKSVGYIGILLPFILLLGLATFNLFIENITDPKFHYPESISHYYYSIMGGVFVGSLCAVALFMFYYSGYTKRDNITGHLAGFFALGVAWIPTTEVGVSVTGYMHYVSAALFFACLAYFSIKLFTKTKEGEEPSPEKLKRNKVYRACGWFMVFCLFSMAFYSFVLEKYLDIHIHYFIYVGETLSLLAFGVSWLTKGGAIYKDKEDQVKLVEQNV